MLPALAIPAEAWYIDSKPVLLIVSQTYDTVGTRLIQARIPGKETLITADDCLPGGRLRSFPGCRRQIREKAVQMFQESFFSCCFNDGKNIIYVSLEKDRSIRNMQSAEGLFFEVFHEDLCKNGR
ncbi:hypothetical protein M514_04381 [Trichuris suis]|uniref:Uncharacterized protein n=1 Tax=Trichuris suis TaxID=68888 RepID=A0A085N4I0_9BILA|nr:hypothetical protein M513_04381 [Trichuris suis]KFD64376.1 hypothetical protein M514_04381 [Trichuris suis]